MPGHQPEDIRRQHRISAIAGRYGVALKRDGREWRALCPFHAEDTPSFTVFPGKDGAERFHCFGCGESGDVIDLVQQLTGKSFPEAMTEIAGDAPPSPSRARAAIVENEDDDPYRYYQVTYPPRKEPPLEPGKPTPRLLNPKRINEPGRAFVVYTPTLVHPYRVRDGRLLGYVLRVDGGDGRKFTPTILWHKNAKTGFNGWSHGPMPTPRPLYRLDELIARPQAQVLLVEGEKCADAAAAIIPEMVATTWCGGGKAFQLTNWKPLARRSIVIWMDNDQEGERTMLGDYDRRAEWRPGVIEELLAMECRVKVVPRPGKVRPDGWDIADAVNVHGWTKFEALTYLRAEKILFDADSLKVRKQKRAPKKEEPQPEVRTVEQPKPEIEEAQRAHHTPPGPRQLADNVVSLHGGPVDMGRTNWRAGLIYSNDGDKVKPKSTENYRLFVSYLDQLRGVFGWNSFASLIYVMRPPPWKRSNGSFDPRPLTDNDIISCTGYLEKFHLTPSVNDIGKAVQVASMECRFNPVVEYFDALKWDGVPRLQGGGWEGASVTPWLAEYLGADDTNINQVFGMRWLISIVARGYQPGCKVDTMLILESPQGFKKSWALRTLATLNGKSYFTDDLQDMHGKDADLVLQGMLIAEIAELAAFNRTEYNQAKKFMTKQVARFRPPYGKTVQDFPRTCVLAGTVNPGQTGYLRDPTGARRYWPVRVTEIDNKKLERDRDQLWAEAVDLYHRHEQWWLTEEENKLADKLQRLRYEDDPWKEGIDRFIRGRGQVTLAEIMHALEIPVERRTTFAAKRVIDHLAMAGFRKRETRDMSGLAYFVFDAPKEEPLEPD